MGAPDMVTQSSTNEEPTLAIRIDLSSAWSRLMNDAETTAQIRHRTEQTVAALLEGLGIPGRSQVELLIRPEVHLSGPAPLFRLSVGGRSCRFSDDVVLRAYSYLESTPLLPYESLDRLPEWLNSDAPNGATGGLGERAG